MNKVQRFLRDRSSEGLLSWAAQVAATLEFCLPYSQVEETALEMGILPARYQRNRNAISVEDQLTLFRSYVAVIGCGGLGGYVIEELARLGVGTITAFDPDTFEEHNLNRQILSTPELLGCPKVDAAASRVAHVNPAVTLVPLRTAYAPENGHELLADQDVVVDALDSIPTRLALAGTCAQLGIPLVHGAIAGWYGHVATQLPGDDTIQKLYSRWRQGKGAEAHLGNPSFTPALVASIEAAEVCKILLGVGHPLQSRQIAINLLEMTFEEVVFEPTLPDTWQLPAEEPVSTAMRHINRVNKLLALKKNKPSD